MHPVCPTDAARERAIRCLRAAVTVRREKKNLVIVAGKIRVLKIDALVVPVPDYLRVITGRAEMRASDSFFDFDSAKRVVR